MVEYSTELHSRCFPFLDKPEAEVLLAVMESVSIKEGEILYRTNDPADRLYVLNSGKLAVQKLTGFGDRMQVVALLESGAPVGESGLLPARYRGSLVAVVADSHLLSLSRQSFAEVTAKDPVLAVKVLEWLMGRMTWRLHKSSERLAHVL